MLIRTRHPSQLTVPRLALLAVVVMGVLVAFVYPPSTPSEPVPMRCRHGTDGWEGVERLSHRIGGGKQVVVEHCRRWVDWRRWRHRVRATVWRHGREVGEQILFEGMTTDDGVEVRFVSTGSPFQIQYECGDLQPRTQAPHTCSRRWRWSEAQGKLIVTSPVW